MTLWGIEKLDDTRICIHCREEKHVTLMEPSYQAARGRGVRNECLECRDKIKKVIANLKKEYAHLRPHPTDTCLICERVGTDIHFGNAQGLHKKKDCWVLDHCHDKNIYRGWICGHCNNGLSGFKDNINSLERALLYLKGELRNDSPSVEVVAETNTHNIPK